MPPDYKETFEFFFYPFLKMFGITDDAGNEETDGVIDKFLFSMPLFLDIAFAYPPPTVRHDLPLFIDLPGQEDVLFLTNRIFRADGSDLFWELVALEKDRAPFL